MNASAPARLRDLLLTTPPELPTPQQEADAGLLHQLLDAAMRACDHHGDGPAAREQMRLEILETPEHRRADLLDYLQRQYPALSRNAPANAQ